jgi:hypothetical protein
VTELVVDHQPQVVGVRARTGVVDIEVEAVGVELDVDIEDLARLQVRHHRRERDGGGRQIGLLVAEHHDVRVPVTSAAVVLDLIAGGFPPEGSGERWGLAPATRHPRPDTETGLDDALERARADALCARALALHGVADATRLPVCDRAARGTAAHGIDHAHLGAVELAGVRLTERERRLRCQTEQQQAQPTCTPRSDGKSSHETAVAARARGGYSTV